MSRYAQLRPMDQFRENTGGVAGPETGLGQSNGDIYTSFWKGPEELAWSIGKTDVWDRRYYGDSERVGTLKEIIQTCMEGEMRPVGLPGTAHELGRAYDFPCPKPVGQIIIRAPEMEGAELFDAGLNPHTRILHVSAAKGGRLVGVDYLICTERPVMLFSVNAEGIREPLRFELYRHRDTLVRGHTVGEDSGSFAHLEYDYDQDPDNGPMDRPEVGTDGRYFWIRQRFPAEKTYSEGFEYVMMALLPGVEYEVSTEENVLGAGAKAPIGEFPEEALAQWHGAHLEKRYAAVLVNEAPGWLASARVGQSGTTSFRAYVSVATTRDAADPFAAAREALDSAAALGYDCLLEEHSAARERSLNASMAIIGDPEFDPEGDGRIYLSGAARQAGKVPMFNATAPLYTDATPWHGDYHFNEMWLHPSFIANHPEDHLPWMDMLEEILPRAQRNAREVYDCSGCVYTHTHYPVRCDRIVYTNQTWELGIEMTAMVLKVYWEYYKFTGDLAFLRDRGYPILREAARFYADYCKLGEDGFYHIFPTVSQENWGLTHGLTMNHDSVGALSQVRYHLLACAEGAGKLGLDEGERAVWVEIAEKMAPYPTYMTDEGPIFVDVRGAEPSMKINTHADLSMITFGDQVHIDGDPTLLEIGRRTARMMYPPPKDGGHARGRINYYRAVERRLGLERTVGHFETEDLLMSFTGRMHFFLGIAPDLDARFERLLAFGGFEVSATRQGGTVREITIRSLGGERCRLKNPWSTALVVTGSAAEVQTDIEGDTVAFDTITGETYRVNCP